MDKIKVRKKGTVSNEDNQSKIKVRYKDSYINNLKTTSSNSSKLLNEYITRRQNNEYMTADDINRYKGAVKSYTDSSKELYKIYGITAPSNTKSSVDTTRNNEMMPSITGGNSRPSFATDILSEDINKIYSQYSPNIEEAKYLAGITSSLNKDEPYFASFNNAAEYKGFSDMQGKDLSGQLAVAKEIEDSGDTETANTLHNWIFSELSLDELNGLWSGAKEGRLYEKYYSPATRELMYQWLENKTYEDARNTMAAVEESISGIPKHTVFAGVRDDDYTEIENGSSLGDMIAYAEKQKDPAAWFGMTEDQYRTLVTVYNSYPDEAKIYLDAFRTMQPLIYAEERLANISDVPIFREIDESILSFDATVDSMIQNWKYSAYNTPGIKDTLFLFDNGNNVEQLSSVGLMQNTGNQIAYSEEYQNAGAVGKFLMDTTQNVGNVLVPAIASFVANTVVPGSGPLVAKATLGYSAGGGAYAQAIREGYSEQQASNYGVLIASSEIALESIFGGIGMLGNSLTKGAVKTAISSIDNALLKLAVESGVSMLGEGAEEYLQEILEPVYRNLIFDENNEFKAFTPEAAYAALLAAFTTVGFEVAPNAVGTAINNSYNKRSYRSEERGLVDTAIDLNPDTRFAQRMKRKIDAGKSLSGNQITTLLNYTDRATIKKDVGTIASAAKARLKTLGETENLDNLSRALAKQAIGESLSVSERRAISDSKYGQRVSNELDPENIASGDYTTEWSESIGTQRVNAIPYNLSKILQSNTKDDEPTEQESVENISAPEFESIVNLNDDEIGYRAITAEGKDVVVTGVDPETGDITTTEGKMPASQVSFSDKATKVMFDNAGKYSDSVADLYISAYDPKAVTVPEYDKQFARYYKAGNVLGTQSFEKAWESYNIYGIFSKDVAEVIYKAGQNEARIANQVREEFRRGDRRVYVDVDRKTLTQRQKASLEAMESIARATGIKFYTFASYVKDGKRYYKNSKGVEKPAPNGYYDPKDSSIHIDLNAGRDGEGTMLFTVAHELTHYIKQWSPTKFGILADFLLEQYAEKDVSVEALVQAQIEKAKANGRDIDPDTAFEEVIADSMESMLTDGKVAEKISLLAEKDMNLAKKIKSYLKQLFEKIRNAYKGLNPGSREGRLVAEMGDAVEKLQNLFAEAIADASVNKAKAESADTNNLVEEYTEGSDVKYSEKDYPIDPTIKAKVDKALKNNGRDMHELSVITPEQNKDINRLTNITKNDLYRGKFTGGKHLFSENAIRHIIAEHGDFLREALRAQLPMTADDIARHLSAIKDNKHPSNTLPSKTREGYPSILTSYEINGYTLYAEEIKKPLGKNRPSDLVGHTIYKAPTLPTAASYTTSVQAQPKRQSLVLCNYYTTQGANLSTGNFVSDKSGNPALLIYYTDNGALKHDAKAGGIIALSSDGKNFTDRNGVLERGYVTCKKPFYISQDNRVFSNSETNVIERINDLKKQGYDCFIFDKSQGDNYMVAIVNKAQIVKQQPTILYSDRDSVPSDTLFDQLNIKKAELAEETKKQKAIEESEERASLIQEIMDTEATPESLEKYSEWSKRTGFDKIVERVKVLEKEVADLSNSYKEAAAKERKSEEEAKINESGLSEAEYYRGQAVEEFGYTPYFYDAGYLLPDGKLLNFSGEKDQHFGMRGEDHRAIGIIYADVSGGKALVKFMSDGNIRVMAETPGVDIITTTEPTSKQYSVIKDFVREYKGEGFFCVDFTDENGRTVGNYTYKGSPNPDRVVNDIKYFYENGEVREQSDISSFLYQDRGETSSRSILAGALEGTAQTDAEKVKLAEYREKAEALDQKQAELAKVRAEIKKLSFTKGKRDTAKISELRKKAAKLVSSINYYDKQLLSLESTKVLKDVLQREKTKAVERQKAKDAKLLENFKTKAGAQQEAITKRYQEVRKRSVEGRKKTALRHDILDTIKDLKKLLDRGTKDRNVKNGMRATVSSAIALGELLFGDHVTNTDIARYGVDSVTEKEAELLEKYRELLIERDELNAVAENTDPETVKAARTRISSQISRLNDQLSDLFEREKSRLNRVEAKELIQALKREYEALQNSEDDYIKGAYNPEMAVMFDAVESELKDAVAGDLTLMQLQRVRDLYKMLKHTVSTSNKMFGESRKETLSEMVYGVQNEILHWAKDKKDPVKLVNEVMHGVKSYGWNELKPVYAFETIGSDMFKSLYMDAVYAEGVFATDIDEARNFIRTQRSEHGYYSWDMNTATKFTIGDKEISLTLGEMMTVYALAKREQALEHMTVGGFKFGTDSKYKNTKKAFEAYKSRTETADPFTVDTTTIANITAALTPEQRDYVDKMQRYMSEVMGEKGNAVSRQLYGIDLFTEENYMPIQSVKDYISSISQALNAAETQVSLKNTGVSKPTVPHASNPLILRSFEDVWLEHIDTMAKYHAFVLPIENLQRVFNSSKRNESGHRSTQAVITKTFGNEATAYISQYIKDLNGGAKVSGYNGGFMQLFGKFKKTAVAASLSVAIQQPWAIVRAMDMVSPIYFREFLTTTTNMALNKEYDELRKYAPVAILKEIGGFDIGSSRSATEYMDAHVYDGVGAKVKGVFTDSKYRASSVDNAVMGLASQMDKLGWTTIWEAIKREQRAHYKHLDKKSGFFKSDEFLEKCGKRFTEVIAYTQVYDSVNSRSGMMRSKHDLVKFATSFMGEPTTVVNQAYFAALRVARAETGARGRAVARSLRTAGVLGLSIVLTKAAAALIYAGRDDDEDEGYWEKWLQSFGKNLKSEINPMNSLPFMRDLVSLWDGWSIERPDMTLLAEATGAFRELITALTDEEKSIPLEEIFTMADHGVNMLGFPLRNIRRDTKAIINIVTTAFDGIGTDNPGQAFIEGWNGESPTSKDSVRKIEGYVNKGKYDDAKRYVDNWVTEKAGDKASNDGYDINNVSEYLKTKYIEAGKSTVRSAFTAEFKKKYLKAVSEGDAKTTKSIRVVLYNTGLYDDIDGTFLSWRRDDVTDTYCDLYKQAYLDDDEKEMQKIKAAIVKTDLWTVSEVNQKLKSWRKSADELVDKKGGT